MQSAASREPAIEFCIGPHGARPNWRVLRVTFERCSEHEHRVALALKALVAPDPAHSSPPVGGEEHSEQVRDGLVLA